MWRGACAFFGWGRRTEEGGGGGQARQVDHVEPLSTPARCAAVQVPRLHDARATPRDCILASARGPDAAAARGGRDRESEQTTGHVWIVPRSGSESDLLFQLKNKQLCPGFAARAGPGPRRARGPDRAPRGDPQGRTRPRAPGRARRAAARGTASAAMGRASSGTRMYYIFRVPVLARRGPGAVDRRGRRVTPRCHTPRLSCPPALRPRTNAIGPCHRPCQSYLFIRSTHITRPVATKTRLASHIGRRLTAACSTPSSGVVDVRRRLLPTPRCPSPVYCGSEEIPTPCPSCG